MKKYILLLLVGAFLTNCSSTTSELSTKEHTDGKISINLPASWSIIDKNSDKLPNPKTGKIVLAASSEEIRYGFANNILILSQNLNKITTSKEFSILNNVGSTKDYSEYLKLANPLIEFDDKDTSYIYIFEAKYNSSSPKLKFLQVGKVCNNVGYLATIAISTDIKSTSRYENLLKTFKCK